MTSRSLPRSRSGNELLSPVAPSSPSHSPSPLPYLTSGSADENSDDDVSDPHSAHSRGRYHRRSISAPSDIAQQRGREREREMQHLSKLQAMPAVVAPTSAVDFARGDASVLGQLLTLAADEVGGRHGQSEKSERQRYQGLTAVKCVATTEVLHSITTQGGKRSVAERAPSTSTSTPMSPVSPNTALSASCSLNSSFSSSVSSASSSVPSSPLPPLTSISSCNSNNSATSPPLSPTITLTSPVPTILPADSNLHLVGDATLDHGRHAVYAANLTYPLTWCPTLHLAPYHIVAANNQLSEHEIIDWCLSVFGTDVVTEAVSTRLLALESARWAAFLAPFASDEYVTLLGRFLALFVIIDDQLIEQAVPLGLRGSMRLIDVRATRAAHTRRRTRCDSWVCS